MRLAAVTVTFNPEPTLLARQLAALPRACLRIIVDNGSAAESVDRIRDIAIQSGATLLENPGNLGLATALNIGLRHALATECSHAVLLDQDSIPEAGATEALLDAFLALKAAGRNPGCVGPCLVDADTGLQHGFHSIRGLRWVRLHPPGNSTRAVACASINGSGTLMQLSLWEELGGLDEPLFIDHVDTEWSFRVASQGYGLFGIPWARFSHRMGDHSLRFWWFGWRLWPYRSPLRHRYLFRNAVLLARRTYVPMTWKSAMVLKLGATLVLHAIFDPARYSQARAMLAGAAAGIWRPDVRLRPPKFEP